MSKPASARRKAGSDHPASVSASPEARSLFPERLSAIPERVLAVPERVSAIPNPARRSRNPSRLSRNASRTFRKPSRRTRKTSWPAPDLVSLLPEPPHSFPESPPFWPTRQKTPPDAPPRAALGCVRSATRQRASQSRHAANPSERAERSTGEFAAAGCHGGQALAILDGPKGQTPSGSLNPVRFVKPRPARPVVRWGERERTANRKSVRIAPNTKA